MVDFNLGVKVFRIIGESEWLESDDVFYCIRDSFALNGMNIVGYAYNIMKKDCDNLLYFIGKRLTLYSDDIKWEGDILTEQVSKNLLDRKYKTDKGRNYVYEETVR